MSGQVHRFVVTTRYGQGTFHNGSFLKGIQRVQLLSFNFLPGKKEAWLSAGRPRVRELARPSGYKTKKPARHQLVPGGLRTLSAGLFFFYRPSSSRVGSSSNLITFTRKVTELEPSITRWS